MADLMFESGARSLLMGALIFLCLGVLRIRQVKARRAAWRLALLGALMMPALVALQVGPRVLPALRAPVLLPMPPAVVASARPQAARAALPADAPGQATIAAPGAVVMLAVARDLYVVVAVSLLLRLLVGLALARTLRAEATPLPGEFGATVRATGRVVSPVTLGSTILLPVDHAEWTPVVRRVILSHELAHVRHRDFYWQLLSSVHVALFWLNPFAWWLKRELADLGEALSDHAAVHHAESRASYAELLLAFACARRGSALERLGVGMAARSNLEPRIERLLSDKDFERSFGGPARLTPLAAGAAMLALLGASATARVETRDGPPERRDIATVHEAQLAAADQPLPPPAPALEGVRLPAPQAAALPSPPVPPGAMRPRRGIRTVERAAHDGVVALHIDGNRVTVDSDAQRSSGGRAQPQGDYLFSQHGGKTYLIDDPQVLAEAKALLAPLHELEREQRDLGSQQEALGRRQAQLAHSQGAVTLKTPDFNNEIAELNHVAEQMRDAQGEAQISPEAIAQLQARLARIEGHLAGLESHAAAEEGRFGEEQGGLGEQQGKLGEAQGRLGERQEQVIEEALRKLNPHIDRLIEEGRAQMLL